MQRSKQGICFWNNLQIGKEKTFFNYFYSQTNIIYIYASLRWKHDIEGSGDNFDILLGVPNNDPN